MDEVASLCKQYAAEYLKLCNTNSVHPVMKMAVWKRPAQDWVKVNSDGAFSENTGEGRWGGVVIRDEEGEVVEYKAYGCLPVRGGSLSSWCDVSRREGLWADYC